MNIVGIVHDNIGDFVQQNSNETYDFRLSHQQYQALVNLIQHFGIINNVELAQINQIGYVTSCLGQNSTMKW